MFQTIGAIPYNAIITKRRQAVSLFPVGNSDQQTINAMKLGSRRHARRYSTVPALARAS